MSKIPLAAGATLVLLARVGDAQSTAAYRAQLDSLVREWRPMAVADARREQQRPLDLPAITFRAGAIAVATDSANAAIARPAAERLDAIVTAAYGASAARLGHLTFVVRTSGTTVIAAVADSSGRTSIRGGVLPTADALTQAWETRAATMFFDGLDQDLRQWIGDPLPLEPLRRPDWTATRVRLLLEGSKATRDCANGSVAWCEKVLGLSMPDDPLTAFYDASERTAIIESYMSILRRVNPATFDRCVQSRAPVACDSVGQLIPPDAVPLPATPAVRQEFVRFALEQGGAGAIDRLLQPGSNLERVERASRLRVDTLVSRWRTRFSDTRSTSTAIDGTTAVSSLLWAAACTVLALRSSRWR